MTMSLILLLSGLLILWVIYGICWIKLSASSGVVSIKSRSATGVWSQQREFIPKEPVHFVLFMAWLILFAMSRDALRADMVSIEVEVL